LDNHNNMHDEQEEHLENNNQFSGHQIDEAHSKELSLSPVELLTIDDGLSLLVNKKRVRRCYNLASNIPKCGYRVFDRPNY